VFQSGIKNQGTCSKEEGVMLLKIATDLTDTDDKVFNTTAGYPSKLVSILDLIQSKE
jgi:hypothetical protein